MVESPTTVEIRARMIVQEAGCKLRPHGAAWRIVGPGVDLLLSDLRSLRPSDLEPAPMPRGGWDR